MTDELKQWEYDRGYAKGKADILDKIRAEIEAMRIGECSYDEGINAALSVIEKYTKEG